MSDTQASIRAAREVQADTLAPELFRQSNEWFLKARSEYKFKNFALTQEYAAKARRFAEQAEFEAIRIGGNRTEVPADPALTAGSGAPPLPPPLPTPAPTGTPFEDFERRKKEDELKAKTSPLPGPELTTTPYNSTLPNGIKPIVSPRP